MIHGPGSDPFGERGRRPFSRRLALLGQDFEFHGNDRSLIDLVDVAYRDLPPHRLPNNDAPFRLDLQLGATRPGDSRAPPAPRLASGGGLLCGRIDADNFAVLDPAGRRGLVSISPRLLRRPYHARYELLEFAVFTLAGRGAGLVPFHAACVGRRGRGLLLVGASGAGKTTLATLAALRGLEFLTEDATFVAPHARLATGVANFLHLRRNSLQFLPDARFAARVRRAPLIERRSGVRKHELDLRRAGLRLAPRPLELVAVVFLEAGTDRDARVRTLTPRTGLRRLRSTQPYAAAQDGWSELARSFASLSFHELRRGRDPAQSVDLLQALLDPHPTAR